MLRITIFWFRTALTFALTIIVMLRYRVTLLYSVNYFIVLRYFIVCICKYVRFWFTELAWKLRTLLNQTHQEHTLTKYQTKAEIWPKHIAQA